MEATKGIKNIIFDWGGVLIDLDFEGCRQAFEQLGVGNLKQLLIGTTENNLFKNYELGNITTAEFREGVRQLTSYSLTDDEIDSVWNSMVKTVPEEKLRLLIELRKKYSLFLLSNTNEMHWEHASSKVFRYDGLERDDFFKRVFLSNEMHLAKPNPEIFRVALHEAGLLPQETLFIDDSLANCQAAASVGLQTVHYIPGTDLKAVLPK